MKVEAELTHPERVDITMTFTMDYGQWEEIHDTLVKGIEVSGKRVGKVIELNAAINEVLKQVATLGKQGLEKHEG